MQVINSEMSLVYERFNLSKVKSHSLVWNNSITRIPLVFLFLLFLFHVHTINAQSLALPAKGYKNALGTAISGGVFLNKNAVFWGLGLDYSRLISSHFIVNISMAYDQEIADNKENPNSVVNTLSPTLAMGYVFSPKFVLGIGIGVGLYDDNNQAKKLSFSKNGNWTAGLIGVYTFYQKGRHGFDISGGIEQGIGNPDLDITLELGYGLSF